MCWPANRSRLTRFRPSSSVMSSRVKSSSSTKKVWSAFRRFPNTSAGRFAFLNTSISRGQVVGDVQQHALAGAFHQLDATQQLLFALGPESLEARQLARVDGLGELGNRADLEFGVKLQRAFRPERRDPCQVPDPGGDLRASFFKRADGAGRGELADLLGD